MNSENITGLNTQNIFPSAQDLANEVSDTSNAQIVQDPAAVQLALSTTTITKSEFEALAVLLAAGLPLLLPPQIVPSNFSHLLNKPEVDRTAKASAAFNKLLSKADELKEGLIDFIWRLFLKSIKELKEQSKQKNGLQNPKLDELHTPEQYFVYLLTEAAKKSNDAVNKQDDKNRPQDFISILSYTFDQWIVLPMEELDPSSFTHEYPSPLFILGALIINADIINEAISNEMSDTGLLLSVSPIRDTIFALGPSSSLSIEYQASAALIAILLNSGAIYKATNDTVKQAAKKKNPPSDIHFAVNYARNILKIISHRVVRGQNITSEHARKNTLIRIMLTIISLSVLYRAACGQLTSDVLRNLLSGRLNLQNAHKQINLLITNLIELLNAYLPKGKLGKEKWISLLGAYLESSQTANSMHEITRKLKFYLANSELHYKRFEAITG